MRIVIVLLLLANLTLLRVHAARQRRRRSDAAAGPGAARQDQAADAAAGRGARPLQGGGAGRRVRRVGPVLRRRPHARARRRSSRSRSAACCRRSASSSTTATGSTWDRSRRARRLRSRIGDLRRQGVKELAVADARQEASSRSRSAYFRTEAAAVAYTEELAQLGVKLAKVQPRTAAGRADARRRPRSAAAGGGAAAASCRRNTRAANSRSPRASARLDAGSDPAGRVDRRRCARARAVRGIRGVAHRRPLLPGLCRKSWPRCPAPMRRRAGGCCSRARRAAVGCIALRPLADDADGAPIGEIKRLYVRPDARGTGLGAALVETLLCAMRAPSAIAN